MSEGPALAEPKAGVDYDPRRLFLGSCISLIATSVAFGVVTSFLDQLKAAFALDNTQAGWIGGAALWGFTISIFILGPLCDALGMHFLMRFAFVCHIVGVLVMTFAAGIVHLTGGAVSAFAALFTGALIISLGNGTVEAACNPLIATIYPTKKTAMLAKFHVWFPGGIVIGGLIAFFLDKALHGGALAGLMPWQLKLLVVLVPTIIYGILFTGQKFPHTERVQSGVTFGGMFKETFTRPLFIVLFFCMMITASLELGPGRWMDSAMKDAMKFAGENAGILVLVYGSTLMAILRYNAGPVVHRLSNTGMLVVSAILGGGGLFMLTYANSPVTVFVAATVFYVGVCYFWPTMLGTCAERVPKGGALALAILGGTGMAVVGLVTVPLMGFIADTYVRTDLPVDKAQAALTMVVKDYPALAASAPKADVRAAIQKAISSANTALEPGNRSARGTAAAALREAVTAAPESEAGKQANEVITTCDDAGVLWSFRCISGAAIVLVLVFGTLYIKDRTAGGYHAQQLAKGSVH